MFKGTQRYRLGEIARTLFLNGASFNANTFYDWTSYFETLAADRLELAIELEADRMVNSRIDKADLDSEMTVVRSELEGGENDPDTLLRQAVTASAIQAHPYHWPVIGWRSDVEQMPREALREYYRAHYGPNNATVVIVGDFETDAGAGSGHQALRPHPADPRAAARLHDRARAARGAAHRREPGRRAADRHAGLQGACGKPPGLLRPGRAGHRARRGPHRPPLPGPRGEGARLQRRCRGSEPPRPLPVLRDGDRETGRVRSEARGRDARRDRAHQDRAHHGRGARAGDPANRVELRLPDGERDGAGPRARLLGHGRRLALPHDLHGSHPGADPGGGPDGREPVLPHRQAHGRPFRAEPRRAPPPRRRSGKRRPGSRSPGATPARFRFLRRRSRRRSTAASPASPWRTASPSSSRRIRRAPRWRSGRACPRGTPSTRRASRASRR